MYFHFYLKVNTLNLDWIFYAKKISKISPKNIGGAALQGLIFQILFVWFHQEIFCQIKNDF
jgi:hypothetical protein